ncbi:tc5 transposase DNA-binding domain-containing protein [Hirsutella rhossiliensis]|uniref:Tc5 transposase DNA-binding domain-containing protein n=1 Tax=Hirsutella rhossiliensis TaxID=111463 RepID=A0A9P8MLH3_9HYPO|nr:tc5 transposase DNA-binding domain-containing protein [Hirsutella rhossiliensis]KAH0957189.1 tc5 transposase DNA-binding domain-containing protein [Hirsutella rhossiliensis]
MTLKRPRSIYTEDIMANAIIDVTKNGLSQYRAAQKYDIPQQSISDRLKGQVALADQIQPRQLLSKSQEARLVSWILRQESLGYAPSHSQIRACVEALMKQLNNERTVGRNWVSKFINRHPDIKNKRGRRQKLTDLMLLRLVRFTGSSISGKGMDMEVMQRDVSKVRAILGSDDTPRNSRQIRDFGKNKTPGTRRRYAVIARGFEAQEQTLAEHSNRIAKLEEEVARLQRGKKRRAPNPNRRFMTLSEALVAEEAIPQIKSQEIAVVLNSDTEEEAVSEVETASVIEVKVAPKPFQSPPDPGEW